MYNFDEKIDRRESNSLKWDIKTDELPMWIADMDFMTAPAITEALIKRVNHGIFGYSTLDEKLGEVIQKWWYKRHKFLLEKDWLLFSTGVIPAITSAIKRLTNPGDNILVQTPVYDIFFHSIENHGRHVVENKLKYDDFQYSINFEDLEKKLSDPLTTLMILCNPQNPTGQIWTKEELIKIGELCEKYHVVVISDEIHCDLVDNGSNYIPFLSASKLCAKNGIMCASASKTFNLAGLQSAFLVIANDNLREKINRGLNSDEIAELNAFAGDAMIAALTKSEEWLRSSLSILNTISKWLEII
jgi:cystathionine beta-lyase